MAILELWVLLAWVRALKLPGASMTLNENPLWGNAGFQQGNGESKAIRTETVDRLDIQSQLIASTLSISSRKP